MLSRLECLAWLAECYRLYPTREKLVAHRQQVHNTDDVEGNSNVISW